MSYCILGKTENQYKKSITIRKLISVAVCFVAVLLNILLTVFRPDSTHIAFLLINIFADILAFCFVYFFVSTSIVPRIRLYKLACRVKDGKIFKGEITEISENIETVNGFDCNELTLQTDTTLKMFLINGSGVPSDLKGKVKVTVVDNIVVTAEVLS